eukprot:Anaeramoba_flamelloidesc43524_g1_i1.p2 GENE.c43524_g1_i1~~c43524_g1_i1.p2  ORF type:complete len:118 (+),score=31.83 c43524_g1_i1:476-829(+)
MYIFGNQGSYPNYSQSTIVVKCPFVLSNPSFCLSLVCGANFGGFIIVGNPRKSDKRLKKVYPLYRMKGIEQNKKFISKTPKMKKIISPNKKKIKKKSNRDILSLFDIKKKINSQKKG